MSKSLWLLIGLLVASSVQAAPFDGGDPKTGQALEGKNCTACHAALKGEANKMYSRADRKMKSANQLAAQITKCADAAGAKWFPEDEAHVALYLNLTHYHFK